MNAIVPTQFGPVSSRFATAPVDESLGAGIASAMPVLSIKGKVFSLKHRGEVTTLMRPDGDGARSSLEVVLVKASQTLSKIFYERGFVDGSTEPPDCWSTNGVTPDATAPKKQAAACAGCPRNAWGSRVTDSGKQGKACADSKRLAVVPLTDIDNEIYGGPILLRVPAASLNELKSYGDRMHALGYPYYTIGTRISFDVKEAYPKLLFREIRPLTDEEADKVLALRDGDAVKRVLNEAQDFHTSDATAEKPAPKLNFEQPTPEPTRQAPEQPKETRHVEPPVPEELAAVKETRRARTPKPEITPAPVQAELPLEVAPSVAPSDDVVEGAAPSSFDDELDAKLDDLLG